MMSGGGGDIRGTISHAKMLVRHGYGVLLFGGRGTGNSEGTVNSYGWGREKDAAAALDYLATRDDVQPGRVGALGLSTGADMAIDIAARRDDVNAVVADGTAAIGYEDVKEFTEQPGDPPERLGPVQVDRDHPGAAPGRTPRSPTRSPAAAHRTCSSPRARSRRAGASSTTAPAATGRSSGTCRTRPTRPRCASTRANTSERVVGVLRRPPRRARHWQDRRLKRGQASLVRRAPAIRRRHLCVSCRRRRARAP